jgi:tRNA threonylcarbamoyladenosine biosynthesis protein TsaB
MRVLALDTTTARGSAALVEDDLVLIERDGDPDRSQAEQLPAALLHLLDAAGVPLESIDVFAVASGPGGFTGLRIGIATIQGLALVTKRPVVPVSTLEALAYAGSRNMHAGSVIAAWMDARRREVYGALYRVCDAPDYGRERLIEIDPPSVDVPASMLARWKSGSEPPGVFVGDGACAYANHIAGYGDVKAVSSLAATVGRVAVARARTGDVVSPDAVQPLYVRRPDAELARDRHRSKA